MISEQYAKKNLKNTSEFKITTVFEHPIWSPKDINWAGLGGAFKGLVHIFCSGLYEVLQCFIYSRWRSAHSQFQDRKLQKKVLSALQCKGSSSSIGIVYTITSGAPGDSLYHQTRQLKKNAWRKEIGEESQSCMCCDADRRKGITYCKQTGI